MTTQFTKLFSFILANIHDPAPPLEPAYRMQCHSCMSPYLEDQFQYISHLYRKPLSFTEKCDFGNFDGSYMRTKNCTDLCVSVRMTDKVGGRRRYGYMRGCMSDIVHYNRSAVRDYPGCYAVRLRDLFITSDRYAFDPQDAVELCPCHKPLCNSAPRQMPSLALIAITAFLVSALPWICTPAGPDVWLEPSQRCSAEPCRSRLEFRQIPRRMVKEIGVS